MFFSILFSIFLVVITVLYQKRKQLESKNINNKKNKLSSNIKCPYCHKKNDKRNCYCIHCGNKIKVNFNQNSVSISKDLEIMNNLEGKFLYKNIVNLYHSMENEFYEEAKFYDNNACPSCGMIDEKGFNTTKKCKGCKTKIIKRSNYLTKQGYLFHSSERLALFEEYNQKASQIRFYESKLQYLSQFEDNLSLLIYKFGHNPTVINPKDLVWNICNSLSSDYSYNGTILLEKIIKGNNDIELVNKAHTLFFRDSICQYLKIQIMEYEKKFNIAESLIPQYVYSFIYSEFILIKYDKFNNKTFESFINKEKLDFLREYLIKYNMSFKTFKNNFMNYVYCYHIPIISKEDCLNLIQKILN